MPAIAADPERAREFARTVVHRLRGAGHEALWAGGCVRDELLGRTPADYDVATSALPEEVRAIFGRSRTLAVGAAFGVITVMGPKGSGQVEVTTFRTDAEYTDGRHPAGVRFSNPHDDAQRRDFTINGLFLDPATGEVHDHVGGRADLAAGMVRAIGVPGLRFAEDHLRMLRAVRFAAGFGFVLEAGTREAIERLAHLVSTVSPERVAAELRTMLSRPGRGRALDLLRDTGLAPRVFPELFHPGHRASDAACWDAGARVVEALGAPSLPAALAVLAEGKTEVLPAITSRLRLSNRETDTATWLREAVDALSAPEPAPWTRPWSEVQPWLARLDSPALVDLLRARATAAVARERETADGLAAWAEGCLRLPPERLDPPPLLGGHDLLAAGIAPGPRFGATLARIRVLQLDGELVTPADARAWLSARTDPAG